MKTSKKVEMYRQIETHGHDLINFFGLPADTDPVKLCKKLHSLETRLNRIMCNLCNTNNVHGLEPRRINGVYTVAPETTEEDQDALFEDYKAKLYKIIGAENCDKVFFNHDPRGYSMKITEAASKAWPGHKDFGGYGIIAPDYTPEA
jgi:hypothetical protein